MNGKLWLTFTEACNVEVNGVFGTYSCIRLIQIDTSTKQVLQDFTYSPQGGNYFFYPALSIDGSGNIIVVYGYSSSATYPSLAVTGQATTDPVNTVRPAQTIKLGNTYAITEKYGDYFGAATDPSDPALVCVAG